MKITENLIRDITLAVINESGENLNPDSIKSVVLRILDQLNTSKIDVQATKVKNSLTDSDRIILTAYGLNKAGIVYKITEILAKYECDIQDLSQKILQEYFTMIMILDISGSPISFNELREKLQKISVELNIRIIVQHEDVFRYMHRI